MKTTFGLSPWRSRSPRRWQAARRPRRNLRIGLAEDPDVLDPIAGAHLCRPHRLLVDLRQAVRHRREAERRAAARARPRDLGRRQDRHHQAAPRREVPRRRAVRRRGGEVQPRPPPHHEGLVPQARARLGRQGRGRRSADHQAQPQGAVLAAARPAHRPRRHDGVAQGGRSRGRQVRPEAGLRRPLQVRRARPAGPHRRREVRRLLEQGQGPHRQDHLPADRRRHGAPRQPALGRPRPDRARAGDRHQDGARQSQAQAQQGGRRSATRASRSTSATAPRPTRRSPRTPACARPSSSRSTATR